MHLYLSLMLLTFFVACKTVRNETNLKSNIAAGATDVRWPDPRNIPVCWEKSTPNQLRFHDRDPRAEDLETFKQAVMKRAMFEFGRAGLSLQGWDDCTRDAKGIHLLLNSEISEVRAIGRKLDSLYGGVLIRYPALGVTWPLRGAIHELGHAVGLMHEHSRIEGRQKCVPWGDFMKDDRFNQGVGPYDPMSLMNYCQIEGISPDKDDEMAHFTDGDIASLKAAYFGVIAELTALPMVIGVERYETKVQAADAYRYKYGNMGQINCQEEAGYSEVQPVSTPLVIERKRLAAGDLIVCLLGQKGVLWQSVNIASMYHAVVSKAATFADYIPPTYGLLSASVVMPYNPANSSPDAKSVWFKTKETALMDNSDAGTFSCADPLGYSRLSDKSALKVSIDGDSTTIFVDLCVAASATESPPSDFADVNHMHFRVGTGYFLRFAATQAGKGYNSVMPDPVVTLVLDGPANFGDAPERIGYQVSDKAFCAYASWQEGSYYDPIVIDQTKFATTNQIWLCIRDKYPNRDWSEGRGTFWWKTKNN